jgi:hypothetical protein
MNVLVPKKFAERVDRHPLPGPTRRHLEHRERIDWHDHGEHQLVYPSSGVPHVRTNRGAWVVPPRRMGGSAAAGGVAPAGTPHSHRAHGRTRMLRARELSARGFSWSR